uniref:PDZ domain-containing protein n=1 Tax=Glossina pallidipes TaxID=7398 RepID=A0A1B0AC32_GLOPL
MLVEMATALLTDCSNSLRESTTSSSSDMLTLTTSASSWCAFSVSSRIRTVRLIRPHMRRILVVPGTTPTFGFTVRGGKEFGTGFFVSSVDRNSEAEQKGLKIGDQILCVNGFKIDDAIHKEFMQLVLRQDRLVLKVRSLGMLPVKQRENSELYWNGVKTPVVYNATHPENSYQSSLKRDKRILGEREVHIVLNVAPKTKLGLGICKGPEWKPGIFVQFTKDKSVARDAGLKPGDQILSVNSIDFADVLFSEAVAVMRSSNKLDMMIRTKVGCDLFPGESSGYNSSASSITGDQSPCWGDAKSKRLISVKEETTPLTTTPIKPWENLAQTVGKQVLTSGANEEPNVYESKADGTEANKTIIKLLDNGTLINNKMLDNNPNASTNANTSTTKTWDSAATKKDDTLKAPPPPPPPLANDDNDNRGQFEIQAETKCEKPNGEDYSCRRLKRNGGIAATMQRYQNLRNTNTNISSPLPTLQKVIHKFQTTSTATSETKPGLSSLSNAISEELKKRKAKQQTCQANETISSTELSKSNLCNRPCNINPMPSTETALNITHHINGYQHSAFINEFKEAHKRMFKNGFKENDTSKGELSSNPLRAEHNNSERYAFNREKCNELSSTGNDSKLVRPQQQQLHKISRNIQHYEPSLNNIKAAENQKAMRTHMKHVSDYENQTIQQTMGRREVARDEVCHFKAETLKDSQIEKRNHNYQHEKSQENCKDIDINNKQQRNKLENSPPLYAAIKKSNYPVDASSGPGILKNGNRLNTSNTSTAKPLEKSIKFV